MEDKRQRGQGSLLPLLSSISAIFVGLLIGFFVLLCSNASQALQVLELF